MYTVRENMWGQWCVPHVYFVRDFVRTFYQSAASTCRGKQAKFCGSDSARHEPLSRALAEHGE